MTRDHLLLGAYAAAVVAATSIHEPRLLWIMGAATYLLAGRSAPRVAWRALRAILLFNSIVSVAYAVSMAFGGGHGWSYLLLMNLRVFVLTSATFLMIRRVNLVRAVSFSPTLVHLTTLSLSQLRTLQRTQEDLRLALRSRTLDRLGLRNLYRHAGASGSYFLDRALRDATEITHGMRSRGFFHD